MTLYFGVGNVNYMESKKELISYIQNISLFILGITLLVFPLAIITATTDALTLPKQILLGFAVLTTIVLFAVKTLSQKKVSLKRTPFDLPVILFIIALLLSAVFAVNKADALTAFVPFLFSSFIYFVIVNTAKDKSAVNFLSVSLATGAVIVAALATLSFFKIYPLPFAFTHAQTFTTVGSGLDQVIYLIAALAFSATLSWKLIKKLTSRKTSAFEKEKIKVFDSGFLFGAVILLIGTVVSIFTLIKIAPPVILPLETGFQTAFAEISQDTGRIAQGFLLGSGFGTYSTDFSRFKPTSFNQNSSLWSLTFIRSSSFVLELLATTGVLGVAAFLFLLYRLFKEKVNNPSLLFLAAASFILPFSFVIQTLFFVILALFAARESLDENKEHKYFDVELHLVAFRQGILSLSNVTDSRRDEKFLPVIFFIALTAVAAVIGYFSTQYIIADLAFQKSLVAASSNKGSQTYTLQASAIKTFPYRDGYYRIFSQTNLALATSLASSQPKGASPSAQTQQTILTLTQQSINAARQATVVSPQTAANWSNLSSIYRALIGFGQNADQFAIASAQQAVVLDPNNPNQYINLGGIYYQLGLWDNAQTQFQTAVNLKPDLANSYYNLGHTYEQKGDLKGALAQYQIVKNLVAADKTNAKTIDKEIEALSAKISTGTDTLPLQNPPVQIPSPPATQSAK